MTKEVRAYLIENFTELLKERPKEISEAREKGIKVVGYLCMYLPEELIYAAGLIPIRLARGGESEAQATGERYIRSFVCPFARSCIGFRAEGVDPYYKSVDAIAEAYACDAMRYAIECWRQYFGIPTFLLGLPRPIGGAEYYRPQAIKYFINEIAWFKKELENLAERKISDDDLREAIKLYNSIREHLHEVYDFLKADSPPISWEDAFKVVQVGFHLDKATYLHALEELCDELRKKEGEKKELKGTPRLMLAGSMMGVGDYKVIDIVKKVGGNIVIDNLCTGSRFFWNLVEDSDRPIEALAERYLTSPTCARSPFADKRLEFLSQLIKDFRVDGVIYYTLRNCESYRDEALLVKNFLDEKFKIPMYHIETEYGVADVGPIRTRIEAFLEMLGGK